MPAKRKTNNAISRAKGRNNNNHTTIHSRENTSDLMEQKIPYYLRRDQKFFSMKELWEAFELSIELFDIFFNVIYVLL